MKNNKLNNQWFFSFSCFLTAHHTHSNTISYTVWREWVLDWTKT